MTAIAATRKMPKPSPMTLTAVPAPPLPPARGYTLFGTPIHGLSRIGCYRLVRGRYPRFEAVELPYLNSWRIDESTVRSTLHKSREAWSSRVLEIIDRRIDELGDGDEVNLVLLRAAARHLRGAGWPSDERVQVAVQEGLLQVDSGVSHYKVHNHGG